MPPQLTPDIVLFQIGLGAVLARGLIDVIVPGWQRLSPGERFQAFDVSPRHLGFDEIDVVIEIPRGSRNKYEYDHERHVIKLDRRLFSATVYPAVKFGVVSFLQYAAELHESDGYNSFDVTRGYFNVEARLSNRVKVRFTPDVTDSRRAASQLAMGTVVRIPMLFREPFWEASTQTTGSTGLAKLFSRP